MLHRHAPLSGLIIAGIFVACGQTASQEQSPQQVDLFKPRDYGTWERSTSGDRIPAGIHPAGAFDWAPAERPIFFHTKEESERTRDEWAPYGVGDYATPLNEIAFQFSVSSNSRYDANFERLPERWSSGRGGFIGFGSPFADEYLHMFECSATRQVTVYRVRDFIVLCSSPTSGHIYIIEDPNAPPTPRYSENDPRSGAPSGLPQRWLDWYLDARRHKEEAVQEPETYFAKLKKIDVYGYAARADVGIATERLLRPGFIVSPTTREHSWNMDTYLIPADHCTNVGLQEGPCGPRPEEN